MNRKNLKTRLCRILLPVLIFLLPALLLTGCGGGKKIDASSLIKVTYTGLNGEGHAVLSFDKDSLIAQLSEDKALTERQKENINALADDLYKDYSVSKLDGLSNGDTIEITGALEKDVLKDVGCTINNDKVTVTVEGLTEPLTLTASDYIVFEASGFNGSGTASAWFNSDAFSQDVAARWAELFPEKDPTDYYNLESYYNCAFCTQIELDKQEGLSNGDTVTGTISQFGTEIPECGITFEAGEFSTQISGLAEPQEVDLASAVTISFEGVIPNVRVLYDVDYDQPFVRCTSLTSLSSTYEQLHNGDEYTLEITYDEEALRAAGFIASGTTASATVEGLPSIDFTLEGLSDPLLADMAAEAEERAVQYVKDNFSGIGNNLLEEKQGWALWNGMLTAPEAEALGSYSTENGADNMLFITCHTVVPLKLADGSLEAGNVYTVLERRTVLKNADDALSSENDWNISRFYTMEEAEAYIQETCGYRLGEEAVLTSSVEDTSEALALTLTPVEYETVQADPAAPAQESIALTDMVPDYTDQTEIWETMTDPYGNEYVNTLAFRTGDYARADYLTNGKYDRFTATLTTYNEAGTDAQMYMYIWGDDRILMAVDNYRRSDAPLEVCLDITGVQRLSIQTACYGYADRPWLFLSNGAFENTGAAQMPEVKTAALSDVLIPASNEMENAAYSGLIRDAQGNVLRDSYQLRPQYDSWMRICLDGAYSRLAADVTIAEPSPYFDASASLTAVADGEVVATLENISLANPAAVLDLDVTDVQILELRASLETEDGSGMMLSVGNTVLEEVPSASAAKDVSVEETVYAEVDEAVLKMFSGAEEPPAEDGEEPMLELACGDYKYRIITKPCNYSTALFAAQRFGGTLAMPKGARANQALAALTEDSGMSEFWIGAQRQSPNSDTWVWADGEVMGETTFWDYGQPDNYDGIEDALTFYRGGTWNDNSSETELPFIIQLPAISGGVDENAVSLIDMPQTAENYTELDRTYYEGIFDPSTLRLNANNRGWAAYDLNGQYKSLSFDLYVHEDSDSRTRGCFAVFGDGQLLYHTSNLKRSDPYRYVTVDVSGVKTLKLMSLYYGTNDYLWLDIVSAWLTPVDGAGTDAADPSAVSAADVLTMETVDASQTDIEQNLTMDTQGGMHPGWLSLDAAEEGYVMYNAAGSFTTLSGEVCAGPYTALGETAWVKILVDGQEAARLEGITRDGASQYFEVDLTGARTVRFETGHEGEGWENCVYLAGLTLK